MKVRLTLSALAALAFPLFAQQRPQPVATAAPLARPVRPAVSQAVPSEPRMAQPITAASAAPLASPAPTTTIGVTPSAPSVASINSGAQELPDIQPSRSGPPKPVIPAAATDLQIKPSWETQKLARTYVFTIPAPRGQIVDRKGVPLAQCRMSYNLAIVFPSPPEFSDAEVSAYVIQQAQLASSILQREVTVDTERSIKHYKNRAVMPLVIAADIKPSEVALIERRNPAGLTLQACYQRFYPQGTSAAHIVGYVGRQGGYPVGPVENNEPIFTPLEGRSGIEKSFNDQLTGRPGVMNVSYDAQGRKSAEKTIIPPTPGQTVVLSIDLTLQKLCEDSVKKSGRPGAMVLNDCNSGEILALASYPSFNPNDFIPNISEADYAKLRDDPAHPLLPRAYGSAYPPGSTFKVITGLAAMNEGRVDPEDEFGGEAAIEIGGTTFRNWKKTNVGPLNFVQALTQSCNTYFYKMGLKCGHHHIINYSQRLGLGAPTGILVAGEADGKLMTADYILKMHKRRVAPGDIANISIGQGDTLVTPLQLAAAMGNIGNGGTVFQPRLVLQLQGVDDKITLGYEPRVHDQIEIDKAVMKAIRNGMVGVVSGAGGTAHNAAISGVKLAAKTGTAQWGAGANERVAAWFSGFVPADKPKYSFAAVYEGPKGSDDVHGGSHAAPIAARVLREIVKAEPKEKKKKGGLRKKKDEDEDDGNMDEADEDKEKVSAQDKENNGENEGTVTVRRKRGDQSDEEVQ